MYMCRGVGVRFRERGPADLGKIIFSIEKKNNCSRFLSLTQIFNFKILPVSFLIVNFLREACAR